MRTKLHVFRWLAPGMLLLLVLLTSLATASAQTSEESERLTPAWLQRLGQTPAPPAIAPTRPQWARWSAMYYTTAPSLPAEWAMSPSVMAAFDRQLQDVVAALRQAPIATRPGPVRLWVPSGGLGNGGNRINGVPVKQHPVQASIVIGPWPEKWTRMGPNGVLESDGETRHLDLSVNVVPGPSDDIRDKQGSFGRLYRSASPLPGTTIVGDDLVVTRPGKPDPFLVVARQRVLEAQLAALANTERNIESALKNRREALDAYLSPKGQARRQERIDEMVMRYKKNNNKTEEEARRRATEREDKRLHDLETAANPPADDDVFKGRRFVQTLRARLDAMTPTERAAPAWVSAAGRLDMHEVIEFKEPNAPGAVPLVRHNPAFFDPKVPRTAFQIMVVYDLKDTVQGAIEAAASDKAYVVPRWAKLMLIQQTNWVDVAKRFLR